MTPEEISAAIADAISQGLLQLSRPLNVSVDGQSIGYGSAAESFQAALNLVKLQQEQYKIEPPIELRSQIV